MTGKSHGHVFVLDLKGNVLKDIVLGEGDSYHPGGIDADGTSLWVPVAEYRPHSHSIVYRIGLATLKVHEEFQVADHVGGIVPDPRTGELHGVTWGSREFYAWNSKGKQLAHMSNSSHFVLDTRYSSALARALDVTPGQIGAALSAAQVLPALGGAVLGIPGSLALLAIAGGDDSANPPLWQLLAVIPVTALVVGALSTIPARLEARRPAVEILQAELA